MFSTLYLYTTNSHYKLSRSAIRVEGSELCPGHVAALRVETAEVLADVGVLQRRSLSVDEAPIFRLQEMAMAVVGGSSREQCHLAVAVARRATRGGFPGSPRAAHAALRHSGSSGYASGHLVTMPAPSCGHARTRGAVEAEGSRGVAGAKPGIAGATPGVQ